MQQSAAKHFQDSGAFRLNGSQEISPAELARTLFEESGDGLFFFEPETEEILDVNPVAQRLCGMVRKEMLNHPITFLFRSEVQGGLQRLRHAYRKTGAFHSQEGFLLRHAREGIWTPVNLTVARLHAHARTLGLITARDISERRAADKELRRSEAKYRLLVENVREIIYQLAIKDDTTIPTPVFISAQVKEVLGYDAEEFMQNPQLWHQLVHPDDKAAARNAVKEILQSRKAGTLSYRICHKGTGKWCWLEDKFTPFYGSEGELLGGYGVSRDITERKEAEDALRESAEHYRFLFANNPHPMFIYGQETLAYLDVNESAVTRYGYSRDEFLAMTICDIGPPEDVPALRAATNRENKVPYLTGIWRHRKKNGELINVDIVTKSLDFEGKPACLVVAYDVTDRLRIEEALRVSEAKYRSLVENLEQNILLKDANHFYLAANRRYCEGVGTTEEQIIGKQDIDFYPSELAQKYYADDQRVLDTGQRLELEEQNLANGILRTVRVIKTPVRNSSGQITGVLIIFWDVTQQRELEAQLRQAQKMEAVGLLAGGVAHDFNNLLTAILGNLSFVQSELPPEHSTQKLLQAAEKASRRAANLTSQLLGFSRRTLLRPESVNLNETIEEVLGILQRTIDPRVSLVVEKQTDLWSVQADSGQMNQILMNLCLNARDAMPRGGQLQLQSSNVILTQEQAQGHFEARAGQFVRIIVQDTGHGIAPEIRTRIFEPFFTTKKPGEGTGLGLSMVFGIVQQHQGWIECLSEVNRGTCFTLYFPRSEAAEAAPLSAEISQANEAEAPRKGTILLADDEQALRDLGRMILETQGYQVMLAEDGQEAVEIYEREGRQIDLVVLDLTMPRLSGQDAFHQMLKINPQVPVLFTSGFSKQHLSQADHERILGFISKPFLPEDLTRSVRAALELDEYQSSRRPGLR
ncbi:MAG TPA: PAS domain S-box protein [Gemmataceae bacterium]|nr:PAS domain S-box protein [Gemmataceae bacterium]